MKIETILKYQKIDVVLKILYQRITESSTVVTKTPIITASHFLDSYWLFPNLQLDEHNGLITFLNQLLENSDELPQFTDDMLSSQNYRL